MFIYPLANTPIIINMIFYLVVLIQQINFSDGKVWQNPLDFQIHEV
jgi:hypothetical protein